MPSCWPIPTGMPSRKSQPGKLEQSTREGLRAVVSAVNSPQQAVTLNSVIDPRGVFVELTGLDEFVEAVFDFGASVSCLTPMVDSELKKTY